MDDFTGDGRLDVLTSTMDTGKSLRLFRNEGDGTFADVTGPAGLSAQLGGSNLVHGDFDNDGRLDILVLRGAGLGRDGEIPNSLLRQVSPGVFADVTAEAGIEVSAPSRTACFADIDLDGDLDLFVGYETETDADGTVRYPSRLWRNDGAGRFRDVTAASGIGAPRACMGAVFLDVDADRLPDLFLSLRDAPNVLYKNAGGGRFVDVTTRAGVAGPAASGATWFFDYDNDQDPDLFVAHYDPHMTAGRDVVAFYRDGTSPSEISRLYENDGTGVFRDVTVERGLDRPSSAMGAGFGDIDGDGFLDIYLATGNQEMSALWPNVMLRNRLGRDFQDVTEASGLGHLQTGQAVAFGDVEGDGDDDLLLQVGGMYLDDGFGDALFENPRGRGPWTRVVLEGVKANRFGVGAAVRVRFLERGNHRVVMRYVGAGSSYGGNSLRQDIALGRAERIILLDVFWPDGTHQKFFQPPMNATLTIREGDERLGVKHETEPPPLRRAAAH
jgi:hypothetical protein